LIIKKVSNDFHCFDRERNRDYIKLNINNENWGKYTTNNQLFITAYIRIYREKGKSIYIFFSYSLNILNINII